MHRLSASPADWAKRIAAGERRAIARALTAIEDGGPAATALHAALASELGNARVIGITGPPGAGKSTLVNALIRALLARDRRVAVLAFDPSSPFSGGAVLGDRVRMGAHQADERVFIRSLAARGHLGGLARNARQLVDVLDAAKFDYVLVETVGTGQSEVQIVEVAPTRIVVCPPGLGDEMQTLKAGVLEIADALVVNKADLPDAERTARELRAMLALRRQETRPPVLMTVATSGDGVAALADWLEARAARGARTAPSAEDAKAGALVAALLDRDGFGQHLGIELVEAQRGEATVRMQLKREHINFLGTCHGAVIFALADMALGLAANSFGTVSALVHADITLHAGAKEGEWLTARAAEVSRTRKLAVCRVDVTRGDGALLSCVTSTCYLTGKALPATPA